ncbi:hypothetical protein ACHHV8_13180 [Paenibacillus sp. TAB 01]|uniref:hypothetical protein n=1 Tax=Paenibacillus sp. TAB 01 TaxID=3368988 RepID=UPI003751F7F7
MPFIIKPPKDTPVVPRVSDALVELIDFPATVEALLDLQPEHTKAVMCRTRNYKYVRRLYETDELYDLQSDPGETVNRIDDPALSDELGKLKDRLLTFYQETADAVPHKTNRRM